MVATMRGRARARRAGPGLALLLALLPSASAWAAGADLVRDFTPAAGSQIPLLEVREIGDRAILRIGTVEHGTDLWISDGTAAGTRPLDLNPGAAGSLVGGLQRIEEFEGEALFAAVVSGYPSGLWRSDGSPEGTRFVESPYVSKFTRLEVAGRRVFFGATEQGTVGTPAELWVMDASPGSRATSLHVGVGDGPWRLPDDRVFFWGSEGGGYEPWVSDGTIAGTHLIADLEPGLTSSRYGASAPFADGMLFMTWNGGHPFALWFSDGTAAGTRLVFDPSPTPTNPSRASIRVVGSTAFFSGTPGGETWRTDGTTQGTIPYTRGAAEGALTGDGRLVYTDPSGKILLTDGVDQRLIVLSGGTVDSAASNGALLAFTTSDGLLWTSDGTRAGTAPLRATDSDVFRLGDGFLFSSESALWQTDGTPAGTRLFLSIPNERGVTDIEDLTSLSEAAILTIDETVWRSDGTTAGTTPVHERPADGYFFGRVGDRVVYTSADRSYLGDADGVWSSDDRGPADLLAEILVGSLRFAASQSVLDPEQKPVWAVGQGRVVFGANLDGYYSQPWVSDGTVEGTRQLAAVRDASRFVRAGARTFFLNRAPSGFQSFELWETDGSPTGTRRWGPLDQGISVGRFGDPPEVMAAGNDFYFLGCSDVDGVEVFRFDFESGDVVLLKDIDHSGFPSTVPCFFWDSDWQFPYLWPRPFLLSPLGERLFFSADDGSGNEPWISDGSEAGTFRLADIRPGPGSSLEFTNHRSVHTAEGPTVVAIRGLVFFVADDGTHGRELWVSDGTREGTRLLDVWPGRGGSSPRSLQAADGRLFFVASNARGDGLFASDGTWEGTRRVADETPGLAEVTMAVTDGKLLYPAYRSDVGRELFAVELPPLPRVGEIPLAGDDLSLTPHRHALRLHLRSRNEAALALPRPATASDPLEAGARLVVANVGRDAMQEIPLPASGWRLRSRGRTLAYRGDRDRGCHRIALREGRRLRIDCEVDRALLAGGAPEGLAVELWMGEEPALRYCLRFAAVERRGRSGKASAAFGAGAPEGCLPPEP